MQGDAAAAGRDAATLRQRACLHPLLSSALPRLPLPSLYLREVTSEMLGQWLGGPATFSQDRPQGRDLEGAKMKEFVGEEVRGQATGRGGTAQHPVPGRRTVLLRQWIGSVRSGEVGSPLPDLPPAHQPPPLLPHVSSAASKPGLQSLKSGPCLDGILTSPVPPVAVRAQLKAVLSGQEFLVLMGDWELDADGATECSQPPAESGWHRICHRSRPCLMKSWPPQGPAHPAQGDRDRGQS